MINNLLDADDTDDADLFLSTFIAQLFKSALSVSSASKRLSAFSSLLYRYEFVSTPDSHDLLLTTYDLSLTTYDSLLYHFFPYAGSIFLSANTVTTMVAAQQTITIQKKLT